jgi:hypothetical protein
MIFCHAPKIFEMSFDLKKKSIILNRVFAMINGFQRAVQKLPNMETSV